MTALPDGCLDVPWSVLADYHCFGCSPTNPHGMGLRFREHPDGLMTAFRLGRAHESYPGVVHGGLIGVVCDETMGNLVVLRTGTTAFTTGMRLRYLAPVAVDAAYECVARLRDGHALIHADAQIVDADGEIVATASATYQPVPLDVARSRLTLSDDDADRLHRALPPTPREEP